MAKREINFGDPTYSEKHELHEWKGWLLEVLDALRKELKKRGAKGYFLMDVTDIEENVKNATTMSFLKKVEKQLVSFINALKEKGEIPKNYGAGK